MDSAARQALIWRLRRLARNLDWPGLAGVGLVMLALGLYFFSVRPLESRSLALSARVAELQANAARGPEKARPAQPQPQAQLASFYERLEDARQAQEVARRLHAFARNAGLVLEQGEYRPLPDASGKFLRYQIVLPVNGTYTQIRRFLGEAMRNMPGLALDGISFQRHAGVNAQLRAQLRFTAFLRLPS